MEYHLERQISLITETKYPSLYKWCLRESDAEGNQVGLDLIPWNWSLRFTFRELSIIHAVGFGDSFPFALDDEDYAEDSESEYQSKYSERLFGTLQPGTFGEGEGLVGDTKYSMFGTNRTIEDFSIHISKVGQDKPEYCRVEGVVAYTAEVDFRNTSQPDCLEVYVGITEERYRKLADLVASKQIDQAELTLGGVSGFYAEYTPEVSTNNIKVLVRGDEHKLIVPDGYDNEPQRLGEVRLFDLTFAKRNNLIAEKSQKDISSVSDSQVGEQIDSVYFDTTESRATDLFLAEAKETHSAIAKLKTPVWIIAILLALLLVQTVF